VLIYNTSRLSRTKIARRGFLDFDALDAGERPVRQAQDKRHIPACGLDLAIQAEQDCIY
jgi:hypothetical protein